MAGFDRFCASHHPGETVLTRELADPRGAGTRDGHWGPTGAALPASSASTSGWPAWTRSSCRPRDRQAGPGLPHMFTDQELAAFFRAADSIGPRVPQPVPRVRDPGHLPADPRRGTAPARSPPPAPQDVDTENAMVMIERSKRNKDRRVPVTDLAGCLPASTAWRT